MMLKTHRQRLRLVLSVTSSLFPAFAWSQEQNPEPVLMRGSTSVPVANTWYVDESGNFVLMSESQRQALELAQLPTPQVPLQSLTESASSSMQIPPDMLQQVMGWSAAMGGVAGGGLVGSLALSSGMLQGNDGARGADGSNGQDGQSAYDIWVNAGNSGSEQDFLNSLVIASGATVAAGVDGKSAYEIWLDLGNSGTEQDFINSLGVLPKKWSTF